jgi:beta-glucanase (GH16 family)
VRTSLFAIVAVFCAAAPTTASAATAPLVWSGHTWTVYSTVGQLSQHWLPSKVSVSPAGALRLVVADQTAGGVGDHHFQTYGHYWVRFKMTPGSGSKAAILLMGMGGNTSARRPEIDFAEFTKTGDADRSLLTATLHYDAANHMIHRQVRGDFTVWHTAGLVWRPGHLTFTLDGAVWGTISSPVVPSVPMNLCLQTNGYAPGPVSTLRVLRVTTN